MFESVSPEAFHRKRRWLLFEVLPLSIAIHGIAIAGALASSMMQIVFPDQSPRLVRAYSLATIPEPPPPPPPPAAVPRPTLPPAPPPQEVVAPAIIPDAIPTIPDPPPAIALAPAPPTDTAPAGGTGGVPGGVEGGIAGGTPGGTPASVPFPDDGRVHIPRNENLPLLVLDQEFPHYPDDAKKKQLEDQVVVRYVIGKNGRVTDVQILSHANFASFDTAAVEAIRKWRFRPMIKDGKPVEVEHDLAVNFVLERK
ncbi:MAG TPA: energy transducer TonB [Thermoanaerobaculia bacterium]|nr:energy transducer TonB [Thermoanaerobaculia bacterium]